MDFEILVDTLCYTAHVIQLLVQKLEATKIRGHLEATKDSEKRVQKLVYFSILLFKYKGLKGAFRLSYWLRKSIDLFVNDGRAHDMRNVAFSAAFQHGTSCNDMIKHGFWSTPKIFLS